MKNMNLGHSGLSLLRRKTKKSRKSRMMNRELKKLNLENKSKKLKLNILKKRGRKPKISNSVNSLNNINFKDNVSLNPKKDFKSPIALNKMKNNSYTSNFRKFSFSLQPSKYDKSEVYYSLTDLLLFLKMYFNIDYENFILKDEQKQEFKAKINDFLKDFTKIHDKRLILIHADDIEHFFDLIIQFVNINSDKLLSKFYEIFDKIKTESIKENLEYITPNAFICENQIKSDDSYKKKGGQYIKYKTIPKWHHYAWDMINQIKNSRKSFIFSKTAEDDDSNENYSYSYSSSKKKLDLDTIITKLKLKIYNNIFEFNDDMMKMIRYSIDGMQRINNSKNISFCKSIEARLQKQMKKLKEESKI